MNQYVQAESVQLIFSGENYFEILEQIIAEAKEEIHLQTYIFDEDETGRRIANSLLSASKRGVKVFVLADAFGSNSLSKDFIRTMNNNGIHFRLFSPFFSSESIFLGRRLHHKVIVADKKTALVGGINIADKYRGTKKEPAWLDYAVLVKGESCVYLHNLCAQIFEKRKLKRRSEKESEKKFFKGNIPICFRRNDWIRRKNEIYKSYREALVKSEKSVIIVASYFLPGYTFRKLLKQTRRRGVDIKIILSGKSDLLFFQFAEKYLYNFLFNNGIQIYEWKNSVLHGKAIEVDQEWSSVGSYNLNYLSHYRSIELNVDIMDRNFSTLFKNHLEEIISTECTEASEEKFIKSNGLFSKIRNALAYFYFRSMKFFILPKHFKL